MSSLLKFLLIHQCKGYLPKHLTLYLRLPFLCILELIRI